ncbi:GDP-mannose 4,6-dehydratase [Polymorphobacter sp. PAMC 29334]|uniref:GDP-mannose 4,6-dehydratase n=1 Tax=Polymorphobacter sp. PAMC 29334 TaxID=2862331 RepID=UPI001C778EB2|nr:GDP-mannose 4,6-dehydratase [Polymorphobacter sp. PAMC 29334]QYE36745.1 GDP-mannose 4,6-dehydratase [Polymorphobacter sp. PAMC 29334]
MSGFTGRYVENTLRSKGHEIVDPEIASPGFDLKERDSLVTAFAVAEPDAVIHLAAISFVGHGDPADFYRVNTVGTTNLLEAAAAARHVPTKIILASSANIYGNSPLSPLTEVMPAAPVNHYACSKLAMELMARQWFDRLPILVTRPFNYTGVGQSPSFLIPKIVDHFRRRAEVVELGNLDVARDFSDVRDVAAAYARLLDSPVAGAIVNICSGRSYSLQWIVDSCAEITGHTIKIVTNPAFMRAEEVKMLTGSSAKLDAITGKMERHDFIGTLRWMLDA